MKKLFLLILMTVPVTANCQSFTLPTKILDSLLWEAHRGRSCDSLRLAQAELIRLQSEQLSSYGKALKLSEDKFHAQRALSENIREQQQIDLKEYSLNKWKLEKKIKKRNKLIIGEGLAILLLIVLI